jgi:hypothetical protein
MNVKQLKEKIANLPDQMEVFVAERKTEFAYGLVNSAVVKKLNFAEEPDGEVLAKDEVLVLDEE